MSREVYSLVNPGAKDAVDASIDHNEDTQADYYAGQSVLKDRNNNLKRSLLESEQVKTGQPQPVNYSNDVSEGPIDLSTLPEKKKKMNPTEVFFAVLKAYCAINVLLLPLSFSEGGYILAPGAMCIALFFQGLSAVQLTKLASTWKIYSYPLILEKAFGSKGTLAARICISAAHFQFTIGQVSFTLESLQSTFAVWTGHTTPLWVYGIILWAIYTPLVCIREIKFLSKAFMFAVACQVLGVLTTSYYAIDQIKEQDGHGPGFEPIVKGTYWDMVGFAFFMFEGIGCLLPIMKEAEQPDIYPKQVLLALSTLCAVYVAFAFLCYYGWGSDLDEAVVTEMLPADNVFVQIMKLLFCVNLAISYPITVVPIYDALQAAMGKAETNTDEDDCAAIDENKAGCDDNNDNAIGADEQENKAACIPASESVRMYWLINLMRSGVVAASVIVVLAVYQYLDVFISVAGAVFGMANVLLLPALANLKLMSKTKAERGFDYFIIVFSIFMIFFLPFTILYGGSDDE